MGSTECKVTVSATDIPFVKDVIEAAIEVVRRYDMHGLYDESVGGAILALDSALGERIAADD